MTNPTAQLVDILEKKTPNERSLGLNVLVTAFDESQNWNLEGNLFFSPLNSIIF